MYPHTSIINHDKLINYFLIAYAFLLPISKAGVNIFEALILITWILQGNWREKYELYKKSLFLRSVLFFLLLHILSIPLASNTIFALDYIAKFKHFLIIFPIYSSFNIKYIKYIFSSFLAAIFLSEIMSYAIFFELITYKNVSPESPSAFTDRINYSIFLVFSSVILYISLSHAKQQSLKSVLVQLVFLTSILVNLFMNSGRIGQVAFIFLLFIIFFVRMKNSMKSLIISILLTAFVFTLAYSVSPNFHARLDLAISDVTNIINSNDYTQSIGQRIALIMGAIEQFKSNFLYGTGIGNEMNGIDEYIKSCGITCVNLSGFSYHNVFLISAVQLGIFGLLSILLVFYSIYRLRFKSQNYKILNLSFISAYLLLAGSTNAFHMMQPMVFFAFFAGLFNKISYIESNDSSLKPCDPKIIQENSNPAFYNKIKDKGFVPKYVAEVGVWHPYTSNIYSFIKDGVKTMLIEPDPSSVTLIKSQFAQNTNLSLHEVAICDFNGDIDLYQKGSSTFLSILNNTPALVNDKCNIHTSEKFSATAKKFSDLDNGEIEVLSIDVEGSEWFVLKHMLSRPKIISIETHGGIYTNPYMDEIADWMERHNYIIWYKNASDTIYVQKGSIQINTKEEILLQVSNILLFLKYIKKKISLAVIH